MSMRNAIIFSLVFLFGCVATSKTETPQAVPSQNKSTHTLRPHLGTPATAADIANWNLSVYPDGRGLPIGRGNAAQGKAVFMAQCAGCHGDKGAGASAMDLSNGTHALISATPDKTIGTYWPYATTLFDFTRRAMPMTAPGSLTNDEVYAVTAYLLNINGVIGDNDEINAQTLPKVVMPNAKGFIWVDTKSQENK